MRVAGAIERAGSPHLGKDAGEIAGVGAIDVPITDDPLPAFAKADGVLDFTMPAATVEFAGYAAQARIVHVIGTTGCSADDDARIAAAARHATIVKSGNMSLGVNLLAVLVEQAAKALDPRDFDIEILEMHHRHKVDAPSGTALLLGEAAAAGRGIDLAENSVRSRDGHTGVRPGGRDRLRHAARRLGGRRAFGVPGRHRRAHRAVAPRRGPRHLRPRRGEGGAVGARQEARPLFDARRARPSRGERMRGSGIAALALGVCGRRSLCRGLPVQRALHHVRASATPDKSQLYCGYSFFIQGKDGTYVSYHLDLREVPRRTARSASSHMDARICTRAAGAQVEICTDVDTDPSARQDVYDVFRHAAA